MSDDIQRRLEAAQASGKFLSAELLRDLMAEARPVVGRFLRLTGEELNERTEETVLHLVLRIPNEDEDKPDFQARTRLLLPPGVDARNAVAFRRKVVLNFLIDEDRKQRTRRDFEEGYARGDTRAEVRERRRRRKASGRSVAEDIPAATADAARELSSDATENAALRRVEVVRLLSGLSIVTRRVAVAVEYGIDPTPWAEDLAQELKEPCGDTLRRLEALRRNEPDAGLALLFPGRRPAEVRESFRKHVERGMKDVRQALEAAPSLAVDLLQLLSSGSDGDGA